ncbi:glycoside hydrolase superfamily [Dipodascopsis tothii]|uniref:glycoside hydrolase superfamily n=1 Tax=Dipodascopsis tothii TaxID=44089 RepID=UPI0034CD6825
MTKESTPVNGTMLQAFEWYVPAGGQHWKHLSSRVDKYAGIGITAMWLPPMCKASSPEGNGYDIYDVWDLGEFDQKGSRATKWGPREDLDALCRKAHSAGVDIYADAVLNHKAAADSLEKCMVVKNDPEDRTKVISDPFEINAWVGFDFPGRGDKYSAMKWHWHHFTGTDYDDNTKETAIYQILGDNKHWASEVDREKGNFDYLMFADIDHNHPEVREDLNKWGVWLARQLSLRGMRFDAVKHFSEEYLIEFIQNLKEHVRRDFFFVGEFWKDSLDDMNAYLDRMPDETCFSLFDAPLVYNFSEASQTPEFDLRKIFDNTLVKTRPMSAVTLVMNHDTQPHQALQQPVEGFFKPLAYAMILLRAEGYPCVFYGDLEGTSDPEGAEPPACGGQLPDLVLARTLYAYGEQNDYFDDANCLGWVRRGTWDRPDGCAVVLSNAEPGQQRMFVGEEHAGEVWTDVLGWEPNAATVGDDGFAEFSCPGTSVAVFVREDAPGRDRFSRSS